MDRFSNWRRRRFQRRLLSSLRNTVPNEYLETLTPSSEVGCKRIIVDAEWLECLKLPNMQLSRRPLLSINERSILLGPEPSLSVSTRQIDGRRTENADVIILANGFDTTTYLHRLKIQGAHGKYLDDFWQHRGGPSAYLSTAVPGFPNFFMVLGPNAVSGHSSAMLASENIANYALQFISLVLRGKARTVVVKDKAEREYTAEVQRRSKDKVWQTCKNGYVARNGWNSSICP